MSTTICLQFLDPLQRGKMAAASAASLEKFQTGDEVSWVIETQAAWEVVYGDDFAVEMRVEH